MLKATTLPLITIFLVPVLIYGQGSQSLANTPPAQEWSKFESKECSFSALFPAKPEEKEVKGTLTTRVFFASDESDRFTIKCAKYSDRLEDPLRIQELLTNVRNQLVAASGGRVVDERRIALSGFRGREFNIEVNGFNVTVRAFWVQQRLYELFSEIPLSSPHSDDRKKFFDSFTLSGFPKETVATDNESEPVKLSEGIIKGKAIKLVTPVYPKPGGRRINQTISVGIVIDEKGRVISAQANSGDPAFITAAVDAAKASIFSPTLFNGVAVRVTGVLTYHFSY